MAAPSHRILVVDDNVDSAESLAKLLRMFGHDVRTAYDGAGALAEVSQMRPEAVLLDIGLPGMDGYEVARRLRLLPGCANTLLIALSGYADDDDLRRSQEAGFNHHLTKPVKFQTLQELLASSL